MIEEDPSNLDKTNELEDEATSEKKSLLYDSINQFEQGNLDALDQILSSMSALSNLESGIPYESILETNFIPCLLTLTNSFFQYDFKLQQEILLALSIFVDPNVPYIEALYSEAIFTFYRSCLSNENPRIVELALYYFSKLSERPDESHLINDTGIIADIINLNLFQNPNETLQTQACRLINFALLSTSNIDLIPPLLSVVQSDNCAPCAVALQGINMFLQMIIQNSEDSENSAQNVGQLINQIIQTNLPTLLLSKMGTTDVEAVVQFSLNFFFVLLNFPGIDNGFLTQLFLSEGGLGQQLMNVFAAPADSIYKERFRLGCGILAGYFERHCCIEEIFQSGILNLLIFKLQDASLTGKMSIVILFLQIIRQTANVEIVQQLAEEGVLKEIIDMLPTLASDYLADALQTIYIIFTIWKNAKQFFIENSLSDTLEDLTTDNIQSNEIIDALLSQLNC